MPGGGLAGAPGVGLLCSCPEGHQERSGRREGEGEGEEMGERERGRRVERKVEERGREEISLPDPCGTTHHSSLSLRKVMNYVVRMGREQNFSVVHLHELPQGKLPVFV